ncbi:hypothetical protein EDC96DRAFT_581049 [Choanephora cucurbitarum]|nr:hypothetical protein EDC96DRAFT_581049 [Choanephora cucurbitarum]
MSALDNDNDVSNFFVKKEDLNSEYITYLHDFPPFCIWSIYQKVDKIYYARFNYCSISFCANYQPIAPNHMSLRFWTEQHNHRCPLILFSDNTYGSQSKRYNAFGICLITPVALFFDARASKNNMCFIYTSNKKLSAVEMLSAFVDDFVKLENGVVMYPVSHYEYVLVVAPLLLIPADNYRKSNLSMRKESSADHFCRKF